VKQTNEEYEVITIVEGPKPEFRPADDLWALSLHEDFHPRQVAYCQMRTLNGPRLVERCQAAWHQDRPAQLDFPDEMGMRQQADIVAARWTEVDEGQLLHLWVRLQAEQTENDPLDWGPAASPLV
jgi:hypothetical protein